MKLEDVRYVFKEIAKLLLEHLDDEDRKEIIEKYCYYCGKAGLGCRCWDDS